MQAAQWTQRAEALAEAGLSPRGLQLAQRTRRAQAVPATPSACPLGRLASATLGPAKRQPGPNV
eukprot:13782649-Alexandrium_andersonii.AAC.1